MSDSVQLYGLTVARQAPLSVGFPRQEYWSGLPCPPPGDLPKSGIELASLNVSCIGRQVLQPWCHLGSPSLDTHVTWKSRHIFSNTVLEADEPDHEGPRVQSLCQVALIGVLIVENPAISAWGLKPGLRRIPCCMAQFFPCTEQMGEAEEDPTSEATRKHSRDQRRCCSLLEETLIGGGEWKLELKIGLGLWAVGKLVRGFITTCW